MKGKRYTTEQKIRIVREGQRAGTTITDVCREHKISDQTYYRWRTKYAGIDPLMIKQVKELEKENVRVQKLVADQSLYVAILREAAHPYL